MKKVLITGGAGFIGRSVAAELIKRDYDVTLFDLAGEIDRNPLPDKANFYKGSILDKTDLSQAMRDCTHVVHLGAMLGVARTEREKLGCLHVNISGTENVLDSCLRDGIKKIIFASSSEVYGDIHKDFITEKSPVSPKSVYGVSKLSGEEYCKAYYQRYGLKSCILRFCNVYGPGQVAKFVIQKYCRSILLDEPLTVYGDGTQVRAFCNVKDAARGVVKALEYDNDEPEVFNIGNSSNVITMKELAELVVKISGKRVGIKFLDFKDSDRSEDREIFNRIPSIEKAKKLLGYNPVIMLEEGIADMLSNPDMKDEWAIKHGSVAGKA